MVRTLREAMTTKEPGLKVIVADGECQLERQRRIRPLNAKALAAGERVVRTRFGVDEDVCTGDHSCIRLSGCPSLTVKPSSDPLKVDPVAHVNNGCVGCGVCGEVAHAAVLCPSFYKADIVQNPAWFDRLLERVRAARDRRLVGGEAARHDRTAGAPGHDPDRRTGRRGRRRARRLDRRRGDGGRLSGAEHVDPRRGAAHRRHDLLHRDVSRRAPTRSAAAAR